MARTLSASSSSSERWSFFICSLLVAVCCCLATPTALAFEPLNHEVEALISIRRSLVDPHGVLSNWDEDSVDPCSWATITCSSDNLVIGLGAPSGDLSGTLSGRIGDLKNLQQVLLQNNNITGPIPAELGSLSKLQTLDLSNNGLSGTIPESLGQLTSLRYLRLNNNTLSGPLPSSLSKMPVLSFLDLSFNNLSGPVTLFPAKTFNVMGNPLICGNRSTQECSKALAPVPLPFLVDSQPKNTKHQKKLAIAVGTSLGATTSLLLALSLFLWCRRNKSQQFILGINDEEATAAGVCGGGLGNLRQFSLRELLSATDNFHPKNILGKGGFGNVYRGRLGDGTVVAVKRLKDVCSSGEAQFRTEVEMISLAVHRNLLRLIGYCAAANERILVYPFMSNGSVASRLRGKPALDWSARKRIAVGAARGLLYLHEQCDPKIIHRDVKAANVLLDDFCEAVIGDFGLAKLLDHGDSHVTTAVRGTVGHIAPEYLSTGQSSDKTDVFGFGILLLELVSGLRVLEFGKGTKHKGAMLDWVRRVQQEKKLEVLVDRDLKGSYDRIEAGEMIQVALLCTQYLPAHRPKMSEVLRMLEGDGLAEKWEASNRQPSLDGVLLAPTNTTTAAAGGQPPHHDVHGKEDKEKQQQQQLSSPDRGSTEEDDDGRSMDDVEEMELSGPR